MLRTALLCLAASALLTGCARTVVTNPQPTTYDPNDIAAQLDFWHELPGRSAITNNEGVHGVILMVEGADTSGSWENRLAYLDERAWLPEELRDAQPDVVMRRGELAAILARVMGIEGGVMMRLTNGSPRYAYREMVYRGFMPQGSDQMVLDGVDFLGVIARCEDHRMSEARRAEAERAAQQAEEAAQPVEEIQRDTQTR
ncbi:MAG: hypothetical protein Tsb0013_16330 [Phycisphaerales bacterium]